MMMTTAESAATDTILAIDLGKYKSVACPRRSQPRRILRWLREPGCVFIPARPTWATLQSIECACWGANEASKLTSW
jgi:hypothetical protein